MKRSRTPRPDVIGFANPWYPGLTDEQRAEAEKNRQRAVAMLHTLLIGVPVADSRPPKDSQKEHES